LIFASPSFAIVAPFSRGNLLWKRLIVMQKVTILLIGVKFISRVSRVSTDRNFQNNFLKYRFYVIQCPSSCLEPHGNPTKEFFKEMVDVFIYYYYCTRPWNSTRTKMAAKRNIER